MCTRGSRKRGGHQRRPNGPPINSSPYLTAHLPSCKMAIFTQSKSFNPTFTSQENCIDQDNSRYPEYLNVHFTLYKQTNCTPHFGISHENWFHVCYLTLAAYLRLCFQNSHHSKAKTCGENALWKWLLPFLSTWLSSYHSINWSTNWRQKKARSRWCLCSKCLIGTTMERFIYNSPGDLGTLHMIIVVVLLLHQHCSINCQWTFVNAFSCVRCVSCPEFCWMIVL